MFKHIGFVKDDGTLAPIPQLTAPVKAPPLSPKRTKPFPPGSHPDEPSGFISPSSPGGEDTMKWPKAQSWLEPAGETKRINASCKIPCDSEDFRIGDGSVFPPTHARSKSYRDAAMQQGRDHERSLPNVALPGHASSSSDAQPIKTGVPDIKLNVRRDITEYESSAWVPRIDQASKIVTTFLRHGSSDWRYHVHSPDGYVRAAILVQLPEFKKHNINANFL